MDLTTEQIERLHAKSEVRDVVYVSLKLLKQKSKDSEIFDLPWFMNEFMLQFESEYKNIMNR